MYLGVFAPHTPIYGFRRRTMDCAAKCWLSRNIAKLERAAEGRSTSPSDACRAASDKASNSVPEGVQGVKPEKFFTVPRTSKIGLTRTIPQPANPRPNEFRHPKTEAATRALPPSGS